MDRSAWVCTLDFNNIGNWGFLTCIEFLRLSPNTQDYLPNSPTSGEARENVCNRLLSLLGLLGAPPFYGPAALGPRNPYDVIDRQLVADLANRQREVIEAGSRPLTGPPEPPATPVTPGSGQPMNFQMRELRDAAAASPLPAKAQMVAVRRELDQRSQVVAPAPAAVVPAPAPVVPAPAPAPAPVVPAPAPAPAPVVPAPAPAAIPASNYINDEDSENTD